MSEERFEQDEREDEDVEAHRRNTNRHESLASDEVSDEDENDEVEAHRRSTT